MAFPLLVTQRDGRPYSGLGLSSLRHHGQGRGLSPRHLGSRDAHASPLDSALATSGFLTIVTAVARAIREDDLKSILASTTLAALGFLTILAAIGSPAAQLGFVIFLTAHALYKAPLFLAAGNLEIRFGTRQLSELKGAFHTAKLTGAVITVSVLSLLGVAPLPGFLGKEYLLKATWYHSPFLAIAVAIAAAGVLGLGLRVVIPHALSQKSG